jgi:hypothetical protein
VNSFTILIIGGKYEGVRVNICEEYNIRENKIKISDLKLSAPRSGFGAISLKNGTYLTFLLKFSYYDFSFAFLNLVTNTPIDTWFFLTF